MKIYSVVFCSDQRYGNYLIVALESLLNHISEQNNYEIIIIDCGLDRRTIDLIEQRFAFVKNVVLHIYDVQKFNQNEKDKFVEYAYFTAASYIRFYIGQFTANDFILYLDVDICIECDVAQIIDCQHSKKDLIVAAPDIGMEIARRYKTKTIDYFTHVIQKNYGDKEHYFNSGVLIINRKKWIEQNIEQKLLSYLTISKNFQLFDQDVLNIVCFGQVKYLDFQFNLLITEYKEYKDDRIKYNDPTLNRLIGDFYDAVNKKERIIHYITAIKPWKSLNINFAQNWWSVCRSTSVYETCLVDFCNMMTESSKRVKLFGLPIIKLKSSPNKFKFYFLNINFFCWKKKLNKKIFYILKIPFLSVGDV